MPAAPPGTIIETLTDAAGNVAVQITISYNPNTLAFGNPAIVAVNNTQTDQTVVVENASTKADGPWTLPPGTTNVTAQQLRTQQIHSWADISSVSIALA
jgi:hypothetical protein